MEVDYKTTTRSIVVLWQLDSGEFDFTHAFLPDLEITLSVECEGTYIEGGKPKHFWFYTLSETVVGGVQSKLTVMLERQDDPTIPMDFVVTFDDGELVLKENLEFFEMVDNIEILTVTITKIEVKEGAEFVVLWSGNAVGTFSSND